jgi:hypothetical protein
MAACDFFTVDCAGVEPADGPEERARSPTRPQRGYGAARSSQG